MTHGGRIHKCRGFFFEKNKLAHILRKKQRFKRFNQTHPPIIHKASACLVDSESLWITLRAKSLKAIEEEVDDQMEAEQMREEERKDEILRDKRRSNISSAVSHDQCRPDTHEQRAHGAFQACGHVPQGTSAYGCMCTSLLSDVRVM